ncbi:MAG: hypothetical protein M1320_00580 [Patescibacteria group bacterium]|nr:hypothetical protein [Patescibacteria group bacterium]
MTDDSEKGWQERQINGWENDKMEVVHFFQRFGLDIDNLYDRVMELEYGKMQIICYLLSKIRKVIKICDFLDTLEEEGEDVDIIKIFFLISHAEITMNNFGLSSSKEELVNKFFKPVAIKLKYKIRTSLSGVSQVKELSPPSILYKVRCEYAHEGNYTGRIFKNRGMEDGNAERLFPFKNDNEDISGECALTYQEFTNIYMEALVENIENFSKCTG